MISSKNSTEVLIGGKVFKLSGFESEDYLQRVSTYLNHKMSECASIEGYNRQTAETRSTLLALNIADDYFKHISYSCSSGIIFSPNILGAFIVPSVLFCQPVPQAKHLPFQRTIF